MRRSFARLLRPLRRAWRHTSHRWERQIRRLAGRRLARPDAPDLAPSPGVAAFLEGETVRQVAYFVGAADPGIVDPRADWPGAVADAHGVIRDYIHRLQAHIAEQGERPADPASVAE